MDKLTIELEIAHTEVDNLNSENTQLKKEIHGYQQKIKVFKSVGLTERQEGNSSPIKFYSPQYRCQLLRPR